MFKRSISKLLIVLSTCALCACGNKGELFLPDNKAVAQVLQPASVDPFSVQMEESTDETGDDEVFEQNSPANRKP